MPPFSSFQDEIYLHGLLTGEAPPFGTDPAGLEDAARERMSPEAYGYVAGGAGTGATMRANRAAFERRALVPRMLRDVGVRDLSCTLFGTRLPAPLLLAPVGVLSIAHPDAEPRAGRGGGGGGGGRGGGGTSP
ncbi:alpha-hydroxy-acid oxidizing protein, partial [Streptomyces sp. NPDC059506]|uniref:alpha-hydroxy-acid oxidizing protein n=1 Tax=Streptomyces sp. NPDC059506 TaxID=3347751 RepID=UPI0036A70374